MSLSEADRGMLELTIDDADVFGGISWPHSSPMATRLFGSSFTTEMMCVATDIILNRSDER